MALQIDLATKFVSRTFSAILIYIEMNSLKMVCFDGIKLRRHKKITSLACEVDCVWCPRGELQNTFGNQSMFAVFVAVSMT